MCIAGILIVSILCYKDITTITYYRIQKLPTCVAVCFINISFSYDLCVCICVCTYHAWKIFGGGKFWQTIQVKAIGEEKFG